MAKYAGYTWVGLDPAKFIHAEQERDDHGRFDGPGGGGGGRDFKNHEQNKDRAETASRVAKSEGHVYAHKNAIAEHTNAAATSPNQHEAKYHIEKAIEHSEAITTKRGLGPVETASHKAQEASGIAKELKRQGASSSNQVTAHSVARDLNKQAAVISEQHGREGNAEDHLARADRHDKAIRKLSK